MIQAQTGNHHRTIIHIGAGDGVELDGYLAGDAERIILVEPEPDRAAALERRCGNDPRTLVIAAALTGAVGEAELKTFNIRALDGLCSAEAAKSIYPGLRLLNRMVVPTLSPGRLLEKTGALSGPARVILHATGMEADILRAWPTEDLHSTIDTIELRCTASSLFETGSDLASLRELAQSLGLEEVQSDLSDPDWPKLVLRSNPLRLQLDAQHLLNHQLEVKLSEAEKAVESAIEARAARDVRIKELEAQFVQAERVHKEAAKTSRVEAEKALKSAIATLGARDVRIKELEAQFVQAESAHKEAEEALKSATDAMAARDVRIKELEAQFVQAESAHKEAEEASRVEAEKALKSTIATMGARDVRIKELEVQLVQAEGAHKEAQEALKSATDAMAARDVRIEELEAQLVQAESAHKEAAKASRTEAEEALKAATDAMGARDVRIKELEVQLAQAETDRQSEHAKAESLQETLIARTAEHAAARSDLAVALRMQAMLQGDLRDLQTRYAETLSVRQQQEDLLCKLTPRLQEAARHIQDLSVLQSEEPDQLGQAKAKKPRGRRPKTLPGA
tara:strand:+ start:12342 stop:14042 length:1701 start_codon:yes stop_codon:yes gene_type:complete